MKLIHINQLLLALSMLLLASCNSDESNKKNTALLQKASGRPGEMIVVMDSGQWNGSLGEAVKNTFHIEVGGLPRQEYMFKINQIDPVKLNSVLKTVKNILFVVTLDKNTPASRAVKRYFTESSLAKIRQNDDLFVYTTRDEYARGQHIMYLFGNTEDKLIDKIQQNRGTLLSFFNGAELERLEQGIYKAKEAKNFAEMFKKKYQFSLRIPFGYKLVVDQPGFVWFRQINDESDKDIFVTWRDYNGEQDFSKDRIIAMRDSVAKQQLFEDPDRPDTHIVTETEVPYIPVVSREYNFNNKYAMETRGLWKTNNLSMGGPFLGYTLVDEKLNRLYYIEGFIYSPGKNQREFIREMEVILNTFKVSSELVNE